MTREPLYSIVYTGDRLAVVPAHEATRRMALLKRKHADDVLEALTKDPVAVVVRETAFGPEGHRV